MKHLMCDFEHMKSSLYQTDVVVLRHEGEHSQLRSLSSPRQAGAS